MELLTRDLLKTNVFTASLELFTQDGHKSNTYTEQNFLADFPRLIPYITVNGFKFPQNEVTTASETMTAEEAHQALECKVQTFFEKLLGNYAIDFPDQTIKLEKCLKKILHQAFFSQPINAVKLFLQSQQQDNLSIFKPEQTILLSSIEIDDKIYIEVGNIGHITQLCSDKNPEKNILKKYSQGITINTSYKLFLNQEENEVTLACKLEKASIYYDQSLRKEFSALQEKKLGGKLKQLLSDLLSKVNPLKAKNSPKTCFFFQFPNEANTTNPEVASQQDKSVLTKTI